MLTIRMLDRDTGEDHRGAMLMQGEPSAIAPPQADPGDILLHDDVALLVTDHFHLEHTVATLTADRAQFIPLQLDVVLLPAQTGPFFADQCPGLVDRTLHADAGHVPRQSPDADPVRHQPS